MLHLKTVNNAVKSLCIFQTSFLRSHHFRFGSISWTSTNMNNRRFYNNYNGPPNKMHRNTDNNMVYDYGMTPYNNSSNYNNSSSSSNCSMSDFSRPLMMAPPPPPPSQVSCGELRDKNHGMLVEMSGRVIRTRMGRFIELKDHSGVTQIVAPNDEPFLAKKFETLPVESIIRIVGYVCKRSQQTRNRTQKTGDVEVHVKDILNIKRPFLGHTNRKEVHDVTQKRSYSTNVKEDVPQHNRAVTSVEYKKAASDNIFQYFANRGWTCGELRLSNQQQIVTLVGWLEPRKVGKFATIKDGHGKTQIVVDKQDIRTIIDCVTEDNIVLVRGRVVARPMGQRMKGIDTGEIEVYVNEVRVLNPDDPYIGPISHNNYQNIDTNMAPSPSTATTANIPKVPKLNEFTNRTHTCGQLTPKNIGEEVTLCGWLEFQRMKKFFTIRDGYGSTQVMIPEDLSNSVQIEEIAYESILQVSGIVTGRPPNMVNASMPTGEVEIILNKLTLLNPSKTNLPVEVRDFNRAKENLRMQYRYIDLRFPDMQRNLRIRSKMLMKMREHLINNSGFVEVETPTLFRRTPGGAQEFVVPTRKPGHFYSLVQSPQQFKQMLMAGAIDRYFQIARCYRDEATRPDRQPEFTQLDIELSFTDRDGILNLVEQIVANSWPKELGEIKTPFQRITYDEAMENYGSDKPDVRYEMKLKNITNIMKVNTELFNMHNDFAAYALVIPPPNGTLPRGLKSELSMLQRNVDDNCRLLFSKVGQPIEKWLEGGLSGLLSLKVTKDLLNTLQLENGGLLVMAFGEKTSAQTAMGRARQTLMSNLEERKLVPQRQPNEFKFLWVIDFPMFTVDPENPDKLESTHHPFTAPHKSDELALMSMTNLLSIKSLAYDLVLNGQEVGGGSIRIHNGAMQKHVLDNVLQIDHEHLKHLIDALESGCPPHGGVALGLDRLLSIVCDTKSIRDVIAFPKGIDGKDHMSKAPVPISDEERRLYHLLPVDSMSSYVGTLDGRDFGDSEKNIYKDEEDRRNLLEESDEESAISIGDNAKSVLKGKK